MMTFPLRDPRVADHRHHHRRRRRRHHHQVDSSNTQYRESECRDRRPPWLHVEAVEALKGATPVCNGSEILRERDRKGAGKGEGELKKRPRENRGGYEGETPQRCIPLRDVHSSNQRMSESTGDDTQRLDTRYIHIYIHPGDILLLLDYILASFQRDNVFAMCRYIYVYIYI